MADTSFIDTELKYAITLVQNEKRVTVTNDKIFGLNKGIRKDYDKLSDIEDTSDNLSMWIIKSSKDFPEFIGKSLKDLCDYINKDKVEQIEKEVSNIEEDVVIDTDMYMEYGYDADITEEVDNKSLNNMNNIMDELNSAIIELENNNILSKADIIKIKQAYSRVKVIVNAMINSSKQTENNVNSLSAELGKNLIDIKKEINQVSQTILILIAKLEKMILKKNTECSASVKEIDTKLELKTEERFDKMVKLEDGVTFETLKTLMRAKGAILIKGAPGCGKTTAMEYFAKEVVVSENGDESQIMFVQFSPSYSYSHIIDGIMQDKEDGIWKLKDGTLKILCRKALENPDKQYFYLIDEINRADTENVVGELLNCIERRGKEIITKSGEVMIIPRNVCIIATMNEFDTGTNKLDSATLSRFAIITMNDIDMNAEFILRKNGIWDKSSDKLKDAVDWLVIWISDINKCLEKSEYLGKENCIGMRDLFTHYTNVNELKEIVKYCIIENINRNKKTLNSDDTEKVEATIKDIKSYFNIK